MKEIKIIVKESMDKDGNAYFQAYLELFPEVSNSGYEEQDVINGLKKSIHMDVGFSYINLLDFPDYIPDKLDLEFNIYTEEELRDSNLYIYTYQDLE